MDESVLIVLGIVGAVCITAVCCLIILLTFRKSSVVAVEQAKTAGALAVEQEKTDRYLREEELKTERERIRADKTGMYVNRDIVSAQLEAGMLGNAQAKNTADDEGGLGGILKNVLPLLMQNPEILSKLTGFLRPGSTVAPASGGEVPPTGAAFPASEPGNS